jgi:CubicO group peptidase (beta-lactamase class C family)
MTVDDTTGVNSDDGRHRHVRDRGRRVEAFAAATGEEGGDFAAQIAAYHRGQQVMGLWGGPEISGDALLGVFSTSTGAAHLMVARLVQAGVLNLDQKLSHYWSEFAADGKRDIRLRDLVVAALAGEVARRATGQTIQELFTERIRGPYVVYENGADVHFKPANMKEEA